MNPFRISTEHQTEVAIAKIREAEETKRTKLHLHSEQRARWQATFARWIDSDGGSFAIAATLLGVVSTGCAATLMSLYHHLWAVKP